MTTDGSSYVNIIPYVAADANTRTNLGLNNFSQNSLTHGASPSTSVVIGLFDPQGNLSGSGEFTVGSNHLLQLNNIISRLGSNIAAGWLLIYSDEPLTAWASVVRNDNNDPAIELAIADQINKPAAFVESTGTRLMIQSSAKWRHVSVVAGGCECGLRRRESGGEDLRQCWSSPQHQDRLSAG